jgi:hypothetical protein
MLRQITIRLSDELAHWLKKRANQLDVSVAQLVRSHLERERAKTVEPEFMKLAGIVSGPGDLRAAAASVAKFPDSYCFSPSFCSG